VTITLSDYGFNLPELCRFSDVIDRLLPGARPFSALIELMSEEVLLAAEYRKHAKALRAAAKFDREAKTSLILKRIADDYEHMARALEGGLDAAGKLGDDNMRKLRPP
jgi:hypothetical protein